jgi:hypothetical protein
MNHSSPLMVRCKEKYSRDIFSHFPCGNQNMHIGRSITAQLQARGCFTFILGYGLFSLLKTLLWL